MNSVPGLVDELTRPLIDYAIWEAIKEVARAQRQLCITGREGTDDTSGLVAVAERNLARLMDYPLQGGLKVCHARKDDLDEAATLRQKFAKSNALESRWLFAVSKALPDNRKQVQDVLDEQKLQKLRSRAERD